MQTKNQNVADYSGVSTRALADLIRRFVPEGSRETWAATSGLDMRVIRCVMAEEQAWTSLLRADEICCALGVRIDEELTVIPSSRVKAAKRMATDELEIAFEFGMLDDLTPEDIERRTKELIELRDEVLGEPTEAQLQRAARDRDRQHSKKSRLRRLGHD